MVIKIKVTGGNVLLWKKLSQLSLGQVVLLKEELRRRLQRERQTVLLTVRMDSQGILDD